MVIAMSSYSPEEQRRILEAARIALEAAEQSLAAPRAEIEPHVESRSERWRREADEQAARFAAERRASEPLTDYQAANLEHRLAGLVEQEKRFVLDVVGEALGEMRAELCAEFAERLEKLESAIDQVKAEQTKSGGEVIPAWPGRKTA
jgi:hypothetical protein